MSAWFARVSAGCNALAADFGPPLVIVCAMLAATLLALIALGFGRWRGWLAPDGRAVRWRVGHRDADLANLWRLYRAVPVPPRGTPCGGRIGDGAAAQPVAARR